MLFLNTITKLSIITIGIKLMNTPQISASPNHSVTFVITYYPLNLLHGISDHKGWMCWRLIYDNCVPTIITNLWVLVSFLSRILLLPYKLILWLKDLQYSFDILQNQVNRIMLRFYVSFSYLESFNFCTCQVQRCKFKFQNKIQENVYLLLLLLLLRQPSLFIYFKKSNKNGN